MLKDTNDHRLFVAVIEHVQMNISTVKMADPPTARRHLPGAGPEVPQAGAGRVISDCHPCSEGGRAENKQNLWNIGVWVLF